MISEHSTRDCKRRMISRRQIRIKVMQAIYAWYSTGDEPSLTFDINLGDFAHQILEHERRKGDKGDSKLLSNLFHETIKNRDEFDQLIESKAENWELDRIALLDRILMQMGICEMLNFPEIPIKVSINEYLEIAKKFSTPKSSKFINGILDSLYIRFKEEGKIAKSGRGLIEQSIPKGRPEKKIRKRRPRIKKSNEGENPENPDRSENPENPEGQEHPENPENPQGQEHPENPENPQDQEHPENPENPQGQDHSENPDSPQSPDTDQSS